MINRFRNIKRYCGLLLMLACTGTNALARTVGDFLIDAPDSLMPYIPKEQCKELVNLKRIDNSTTATIQTMYRQDVSITEMTDDYLMMNIDAYRMNILRLPGTNERDSVFCILGTCATPEAETFAKVFSDKYELLNEISFYSGDYTQKPDTMTQENYDEMLKLVEFPIIEATAQKENPQELLLTLHAPSLAKEDKERLKGIIMQRKAKWNGEIFK